MRTLILGMGNTLLSDDGIGILVKRNLERYIDKDNIDLVETSWGGFRIIDILTGYDQAIVIDAIRTDKESAGYIHHLNPEDLLPTLRLNSYHDINFITAIELGKELNIHMPEFISIYAIEIRDNTTISEIIDPSLYSSIDNCSKEILEQLNLFKTSTENYKDISSSDIIKELYEQEAA